MSASSYAADMLSRIRQHLRARQGAGMTNLKSRSIQMLIMVAAFAALLAGAAGFARWLQFAYAPATAAEYVAYVGGEVKAVPAGQLEYDGRHFECGRFQAVLNPRLDDYGAAYFGFILINPKRFETLPPNTETLCLRT